MYYPNINDNRTEKFALEGIQKIDNCLKQIIKKAYDLPPNLDKKITQNLLGKYSFTEKIRYSTAKIIAR